MDFTQITAVLTGLKQASDLARAVREAGSSLEQAETKLKMAEIIEALADAKMAAAEIQQGMLEQSAEISRLKDSLDLKDKLVRRDDAFYLTDANGEPVGDPFCSKCWQADRKAINLYQDGSRETCPNCKTRYNPNFVQRLSTETT
jgi:uncharacterized protein with ATP-grasp and redox domains